MDLDSWSWKVVVLAFLSTATLSGIWSLVSPIMLVPDEASHTVRAVSLWQGDLLGRRFELVNEGPPRVEAVNFEVHLPAGFRGIGSQTECYDNGMRAAGCAVPLSPADGQILFGTSAGAYQPLWYALMGAPSRVLTPVQAIYAGRLLQALVGSMFFAATIGLAAMLAGRLGVAIVVLGITPTAVWILGSINPNGVEIASATTLWLSLMVLLVRPRSRGIAWLVGVSAVAVAWSRPFSPFFTVGIVATVLVLTLDRDRLRALRDSAGAKIALGVAVAAVVSSMAWNAATGALDTFIRVADPSLTPGVAAGVSWDLTEHRLEQMVGRFGLLNIRLPFPAVVVWALAVVAVLLVALWWGTWRQRVMLTALIGATLGLPVLAEAFTAAEYGLTWQGRYTMPVAFGVLACVVWIIREGRTPLPAAVSVLVLPLVAVSVVFGHVAGHLQTMQRVSTGDGFSLLAYLSQPGWSPPGPDLLLLIGVVLAAVGLVATTWATPQHTAASSSSKDDISATVPDVQSVA
ncbi:MAG: DUF2142 domain-containing protein [Euzebya sp.]